MKESHLLEARHSLSCPKERCFSGRQDLRRFVEEKLRSRSLRLAMPLRLQRRLPTCVFSNHPPLIFPRLLFCEPSIGREKWFVCLARRNQRETWKVHSAWNQSSSVSFSSNIICITALYINFALLCLRRLRYAGILKAEPRPDMLCSPSALSRRLFFSA